MNHWTGEADVQVPNTEQNRPEEAQAINLTGQQRRAEALYGLHNYVVLDNLLKRHLHLDKGFDL
ncbi:MAG TPA: hypothetical protein VMW70_17365 [Burkholderiales bacterium]|nr:hypothetical protein [Burkholderiales bacterium]